MTEKVKLSKGLLDSFSGRSEGAILSATRIEMLMRCPKQFEFRYVRGLKSPPSVALAEGLAAHTALAFNNENKIKRQQDLSAKRVVECFNDDFSGRVAELTKKAWEESFDGEDDIRSREKKLLYEYMQDFAPPIFPEGAETQFETKIDGIPFVGHIDLIEPDLVTDYKTANRNKWTSNVVERHFQLMVYAWQMKYTGVSVISLIKTKVPKVVRAFSDHDFARIDMIIRDTVKRWNGVIQSGSFPPCDPGDWVCSSKFCGYWRRCRGKKVIKRKVTSK